MEKETPKISQACEEVLKLNSNMTNGKLDSKVKGGKQRITSMTSTMVNLFGNLYFFISKSHPLPSFLDLRHREVS